MAKSKLFSPCGNPRISKLAFEAALCADPSPGMLGDNAIHIPSGLRVAILRRRSDSCHVRFPRGAEISIINDMLKGETFG